MLHVWNPVTLVQVRPEAIRTARERLRGTETESNGLGRTNHSFWGFNFGGGGGGSTGRSNEFRGECELFLFTTTGSERFSDFVLYLDSDWLLPELVDREIFQCDFSLLSTSDWSAESSPEMSRSDFFRSDILRTLGTHFEVWPLDFQLTF